MIPHDTRAPNRQQRFVEVYNADSVAIPAHGVIEIVGGTAYETDTRTVVQGRRPTIDGSPHVIINGLVPIAPGEKQQVATNDYPAWSLYDHADSPSPGQMWGAVKDSFALGLGRPGFMVIGKHDQDGRYVVRVTRHERVYRVNAGNDAFLPGASQSCYIQRWDGSDWIPTSTSVTIQDPFYRTFALPEENFFVENYGDQWFTLGEFGLHREGIILSGSSGVYLVAIYASAPDQDCEGEDTGIVLEGCYVGCSTLAVGERVRMDYYPEYRRWKIMPLCQGGMIRFEMLTSLPLGGQGTAIEIGTGPTYTRIGSTFPIKDPWLNPGRWRFDPRTAVSLTNRGYMGWCVIPDNPEIVNGVPCREIVHMEQVAKSINFTLRADMIPSGNGYEASATVNAWYQGKDPTKTTMADASGYIVVYDTTNNFRRALKDAKGMARYNEKTHRYEVIQCNQQAILLRSSLAVLCPSDSTAIVNSHEAMTFPPYGQRPLSVPYAYNIHSLSNASGATGTLAWDESTQQWIVLQVEHIPQYLVYTTDLDSSSCSIDHSAHRLRCSVMTCGEVDLVTSGVAFEQETILTGVTIEHTQGSAGSGNDPPTEGTCDIKFAKKTVCVLDAGSSTSYETLSMEPTLIVKDVYLDGTCVGATVQVIYTLCVDNEDDVTLFCGTTCDSGSLDNSTPP